MSLEKFFNMKPRPVQERMDIENPERDAAVPWVEK
jgi:replication factor C subunit 2/4